LAIWVAYLQLSYWGIENLVEVGIQTPREHTHSWLSALWARWSQDSKPSFPGFITGLYSIIGIVLAGLSFCLLPNTLSLHGLYRDRLRKAFLFDPTRPAEDGFAPVERMKVSDIDLRYAPYHLINTALNIRGSEYANRRGRDADFFLFSPRYAGSRVTGYLPMQEFERTDRALDLASAIAISGAAVSSSMGANSIRPLAPTLALLNIRLGYWLRNPNRAGSPLRWLIRMFGRASDTLLWSEMTGRVYTDTSDEFYLTDGGHIENLGIYELLRRRCRVIVCVDAEADPEMRFNSFVTLQRYASIDLGVDIELPWDAIQTITVDWMGYDPLARRIPKLTPSLGPHAAIGVIHYTNNQQGYLLYIKSSLTGDERDFVRDYSRRYSRFPHEMTGKQFFNEEQFEVYRVLGLHMAYGVFSGRDLIQVAGGKELKFDDASDAAVKAVRDALLPRSERATMDGEDVFAA
jgi:hypothetical protein